MKKMLAISVAALSAAGCSALRSTPVDFTDAGAGVREGLQYAAPKGLFYVELIEADGNLSLSVSEPFYVGDPNASFMLNGAASALAHQEYVAWVDPQTRLLYYINSRSDGQAGQILTNLVRSAAAVAGADGQPSGQESSAGTADHPRVILRRVVDPFIFQGCDFGSACSLAALNEELRQAALSYYQCAQRAADDAKAPVCQRSRNDPNALSLSLSPMFDASGAVRASASAEDCRRAVCYRAPAPYTISLRVAGVTDQSEVVLLPNEAPLMSLAVPAGVFSRSRTRVEMMVDGMPARYTIDRQNELVAVTLVPFNLVSEGFRAIGEVFQFRINYNNARIRQLESEARREDAEDAYSQRGAIAGVQTAAARLEGDDPTADEGGAENSLESPTSDETGASSERRMGAAATEVRRAQMLLRAPLEVGAAASNSDSGGIGGND
jgi:hypothetical protein